jgi:hypothetical protein
MTGREATNLLPLSQARSGRVDKEREELLDPANPHVFRASAATSQLRDKPKVNRNNFSGVILM